MDEGLQAFVDALAELAVVRDNIRKLLLEESEKSEEVVDLWESRLTHILGDIDHVPSFIHDGIIWTLTRDDGGGAMIHNSQVPPLLGSLDPAAGLQSFAEPAMTLSQVLEAGAAQNFAIRGRAWPPSMYVYHGMDNRLCYGTNDLEVDMSIATISKTEWELYRGAPYHGKLAEDWKPGQPWPKA